VARINEAQDQIRGWFYSLMFNSVACFDKQSFDSCSMVGWVVDKNGEKMSKSLGNVVWAKEGIEELGADVLRFYSLWDVAPYVIQKFNIEIANKDVRRILDIFWNVHLYVTRQCKDLPALGELQIEDRWIISKTNSVLKLYFEKLDTFELHVALRAMGEFIVNDLSRTYIKFIRDRINNDKTPLRIINDIIIKIAVALAPVTPYVSEKIYQNMNKLNEIKQSVHLEDLTKVDDKVIDTELENNIMTVTEIIQEILSKREEAKLGVRWPLNKVKISTEADIKDFIKIIMNQTNIKNVELSKGKMSVELDTKLTKELEHEGYSREIMRRVQAALLNINE